LIYAYNVYIIDLYTLLFASLNYTEHLINEIKSFATKSIVINFILALI